MNGKDPRVTRTRAELEELYSDQLKMLVDRCDAYYEGKHHEARSLTTILHNLLYDYGKSSQSVLGQLEIKDQYRYLDSRTHNNLAIASARGAWPRTCVPYAQYNDKNLYPFDEWWKNQQFQIQYKNIVFTREELVEAIRNMEGGSHVDPKINEKIAALKRTKSRWTSSIVDNGDGTQTMGVLFDIGGGGNAEEPQEQGIYGFELASICAIGEELLFSLTPEPDNRKRMHYEPWQKSYYLTVEESEARKKYLVKDIEKLNMILNNGLSSVQEALVKTALHSIEGVLEIERLTSEDFNVRNGVAQLMNQAKLPWNTDEG